MRIATWNVNSIRSRHDRLLQWLRRHGPDVLCLQELKATEDQFPFGALREVGYHAAVCGQKTYNGVAVLSRSELKAVRKSLDDPAADPQARFLIAAVEGLTVASVYVPNGATVGSEKWEYKLEWLHRLKRYLEHNLQPTDPLALCGDFNIAVDDRDVAFPERWAGSVLCHEAGRQAFEELKRWGLVDAFRQQHPEGGIYSWWDYRRLAFPRNDGLRIDHILLSPVLSRQVVSAEIDREERKGKQPSDHAPLVVEISWP